MLICGRFIGSTNCTNLMNLIFVGFYSCDLLDLWLDILLILFYKAFYSDLNLRNGIIVCNFAVV